MRTVQLLLVALTGCPSNDGATTANEGEFEFVPLVDNTAWEPVPAEDDPLVEHRPDTVDCGPAGVYSEMADLEIDTNYCNYAALRQVGLVAIEEGRPIRIGLYYFDLLAPEPAQAHIAFLVDGAILWERFVDIPGLAAFIEEEFDSPVSAPAGADMQLHLHNHGQNTWTLVTIEAPGP